MASLTFTAINWNAPQTVTVTGADDPSADGDQVYSVILSPAVSADPNYSGRDPADVPVTNTDNDSAGFTLGPITGNTTEAEGQATFTVVLNSQPTMDVTVAAGSSDTSEGTASPAALIFTPLNWNAPQTVTVTGVNDSIADGALQLAPAKTSCAGKTVPSDMSELATSRATSPKGQRTGRQCRDPDRKPRSHRRRGVPRHPDLHTGKLEY